MHGVVRKRLEDLLESRRHASVEPELTSHLEACSECLAELESMKAQTQMLVSLRPPQGLEPDPGFYSRVLQRIQDGRRESIWAALLRSPFSSRLAYASVTLTVLLGSYVIASESRDGHLLGDGPVIAQNTHYDAPVIGSVAQQRDAVLENFAVH